MSNFYRGLSYELSAEYTRRLKSLQEIHDQKTAELNKEFNKRYEALQAACPHENEVRSCSSTLEFYLCEDCGKYLRTE